jgi:hypothetical protein
MTTEAMTARMTFSMPPYTRSKVEIAARNNPKSRRLNSTKATSFIA